MVTLELPITPDEKNLAELFAQRRGYHLEEILSRVVRAIQPAPKALEKKMSLSEAILKMPSFSEDMPKNAKEDKEWLKQGLDEKYGGDSKTLS